LVNDHDPCDHSDRRHRCVILYIYIVQAVCCGSHRRLPYIIYTVQYRLLYIYIYLFWGKFRVTWDQYSVRCKNTANGKFSSGKEKKRNGFSIYFTATGTHPLVAWNTRKSMYLTLSENSSFKYVNTQARLLCKYAIGEIHIFKNEKKKKKRLGACYAFSPDGTHFDAVGEVAGL